MAQAAATPPLFGEEPDDDSFWLKLMSECQENPVTKLPPGRKLLVLGDNEAEKTALVAKMQGGEGHPFTRGNGLEYRYISVKDEYDSHTKLGVWILDGDPFYKPLLKYALDGASLADTTVLVVASMTRPWELMDTIVTWTDILRDHIESLDMPPGRLEEIKNKVLERFREYVEPGLSVYGSLAADPTRELPVNLGVELVVVVSRTESMRELQAEFGYEEEHFDFIQLRLREFCLGRGAALFYASAREDKNCDLLLRYLLHRAYAFPFRLPGVLVERDSVLVPAGWDTANKIRFLADTLSTIPAASTEYSDAVFRPARLADRERAAPEVRARRDQEFLADLQAALERTTEDKAKEELLAKEASSMTATVVQRNVARRMGTRSPQKKRIEGAATKMAAEGDTLSNFFHSLLNRRTSAPVDRPLGMGGGRTLAPKHNISTQGGKESSPSLHGISEQSSFGTSRRSSEEEESSDSSDSNSRNGSSRLRSAVSLDHPSGQQLPEYFLSNPGGGAPPCAPDCSFQGQSEDEFLDRVRSSYNPPLRLLLERRPDQKNPADVPANGEVKEPGRYHRELSRTDAQSIDEVVVKRVLEEGNSSSSFISDLVRPVVKDPSSRKDPPPATSDPDGNSDSSTTDRVRSIVKDTTLRKDLSTSDQNVNSDSLTTDHVRSIVKDAILRKDTSDQVEDSVPVPPDTVMSSMPLRINGHDQNSEGGT